MTYALAGKEDILGWLSIMIVHAPDNFPPEFEVTDMATAWATMEHGLKRLEQLDGRPPVMTAVEKVRAEVEAAKTLFERGETNPACHRLQEAERILRPLKVKPEVE